MEHHILTTFEGNTKWKTTVTQQICLHDHKQDAITDYESWTSPINKFSNTIFDTAGTLQGCIFHSSKSWHGHM